MSTDMRLAALEYAQKHKQRFLEDLIAFSAIPSVSTGPKRAADVQKTAEWVARRLNALDFDKIGRASCRERV